jgi:hypothetical protein
MVRLFKVLLVLAVLGGALWYGAHRYAEYRVRAAFAEAGMTDEAAACMGRRLAERLTLRQLYELTALRDEVHDADQLLRTVQSLDDRRIVRVTASSALLCSTGLAR